MKALLLFSCVLVANAIGPMAVFSVPEASEEQDSVRVDSMCDVNQWRACNFVLYGEIFCAKDMKMRYECSSPRHEPRA